MSPRIVSKFSFRAKAQGYSGIEFEAMGDHVWVFVRCWNNSRFRRVCVSILDRFSSNVNGEMVMLGRIIDALAPDVCVVSMHVGPHALVEVYLNFLGSGSQQKLIEYRLFELRFEKMPPKDGVKSLWSSGSLLHDGVHCEQPEGGRESRLDDFSNSTEESHHKQQSWRARAR